MLQTNTKCPFDPKVIPERFEILSAQLIFFCVFWPYLWANLAGSFHAFGAFLFSVVLGCNGSADLLPAIFVHPLSALLTSPIEQFGVAQIKSYPGAEFFESFPSRLTPGSVPVVAAATWSSSFSVVSSSVHSGSGSLANVPAMI